MANNENVNKVTYAGETLIDLTSDTAEAGDVLIGKTFHTKSGALTVGTLSEGGVEIYNGLDSTSIDSALSANMGRVLNEKITAYDYGTKTASEFETALDTTAASMPNGGFQQIMVTISAASGVFSAVPYIGSLWRSASTRFYVTLSQSGQKTVVHGAKGSSGWMWDTFAVNSVVSAKQNMVYITTVSDFNTYCTNLAIGTSSNVNAMQAVMNSVVGRNSFGMMSIVKVSSTSVYIQFANPLSDTLGTCIYNFSTSTTSHLNDIGSSIITTKTVSGTYGTLYIIKKNDTINITWVGNSTELPNDTVLLADTSALIPYGQRKIYFDIGFGNGARGAIEISATGGVKATGLNDGSLSYTAGFVSYIANNSTALT